VRTPLARRSLRCQSAPIAPARDTARANAPRALLSRPDASSAARSAPRPAPPRPGGADPAAGAWRPRSAARGQQLRRLLTRLTRRCWFAPLAPACCLAGPPRAGPPASDAGRATGACACRVLGGRGACAVAVATRASRRVCCAGRDSRSPAQPRARTAGRLRRVAQPSPPLAAPRGTPPPCSRPASSLRASLGKPSHPACRDTHLQPPRATPELTFGTFGMDLPEPQARPSCLAIKSQSLRH